MPGKHRALPDRALIRFAIADNAIGLPSFAVTFSCISHTASRAEAYTQSSTGEFDTRNSQFAVTTDYNIVLAEIFQFRGINPAKIDENRIQHVCRVILAENEAIAVFPLRVVAVDVHQVVVECNQNLRARKRARHVTIASIYAHLERFELEFATFLIHFI